MDSAAALAKEEKVNAISHGIGAALSLPATIILILHAVHSGLWTHMVSSAVFGTSMLILYTCSTALHCVKTPQQLVTFEMMDHAAIYLFIAGTYTPLLLIAVKGQLGFILLAMIWLVTLAGIFVKFNYPGRFMSGSIAVYFVMSWCSVLILPVLRQALPMEGILWLACGILMYTFGSVFYFWRRIRYHHGIWHTFVLAGSACHFMAIYFYVL